MLRKIHIRKTIAQKAFQPIYYQAKNKADYHCALVLIHFSIQINILPNMNVLFSQQYDHAPLKDFSRSKRHSRKRKHAFFLFKPIFFQWP